MKLLVCAATQSELKTIKTSIKLLNLKQQLPIEYFCCWIGNIITTLTLTEYLTRNSGNNYFIVNIGICGYTQSQETCIQGATVYYLPNWKEAIIPSFLKFAPLKKLISSEVIVDNLELLWPLQHEEYFIDMESWAIEQVSQHFKYPRLILKVPIDRIWEETKHFDHEKALRWLAEHIDYKKLVENVLEYMEKLEDR